MGLIYIAETATFPEVLQRTFNPPEHFSIDVFYVGCPFREVVKSVVYHIRLR